MRISHRYKFVFLANPRCGSTSVRKVLDPFTDIYSGNEFPYHHHAGVRHLKPHFAEQGWDWDCYSVFTTIRNPWARVASCWRFGEENPKSIWRRWRDESGNNFDRFVARSFHKLPLSYRFVDEEGVYGVHDFLMIETIDQYLPPLLADLGIEVGEAPHLNATDGRDYRDYFSEEAREIVAEVFSSDIEQGGYSF